MITIRQVHSVNSADVIARSPVKHVAGAERKLDHCIALSAVTWVGCVDEEVACVWGLVPPTLLSTQAYLWLITTDLVTEHPFLFVRHSQMVVKNILKEYPVITGHAGVGEDRSIRWLRWLGARMFDPDKGRIPFVIVSQHKTEEAA